MIFVTQFLKTGQTTDSSIAGRTSKSDGFTQYGEVRKFTALTQGQFSGTTNITVNAKTDVHTNACVVQDNTLKMWNQDKSNSVGPAANGLLYWDDSAGSNEDIFQYCDAANSANLSGFNDWRIPNWIELASLLNIEGAAPYLNTTYFPAVGIATVWSSNDSPASSLNAIVINFNTGLQTLFNKTTITKSAMLVRDTN